MKFEPKILFNGTGKTVEFMCDNRVYIFKPGEKKNVDGWVAYHALTQVRTGLTEYKFEEEQEGSIAITVDNVDYVNLPWRKLVSLASERGVFKPKMTKDEVVKALVEADGSAN